MEKHLDSMVMVARGASRNVRIVRMYPLMVLFTFTMVIIINSILGLTTISLVVDCNDCAEDAEIPSIFTNLEDDLPDLDHPASQCLESEVPDPQSCIGSNGHWSQSLPPSQPGSHSSDSPQSSSQSSASLLPGSLPSTSPRPDPPSTLAVIIPVCTQLLISAKDTCQWFEHA